MVRVASLLKRTAVAVVAMLVFWNPAAADACVDGCRSNHNSCRMAAKLLMSPRCDDQLQACIGGCFAAGRGGGREPHEPRGGGREFGGGGGGPHFGGGFRDRR